MKDWAIIGIGLLTLSGCEQSNVGALRTDKSNKAVQSWKLDNKEVPEGLLTLNTHPRAESAQEDIAGNLFGKFFCDRASFYIIKNPKNEIFSSRPESITLFYLDGELRQTKYVLRHGIATNLLRELGSFRIAGLDRRNRDLISARKIVQRTENGVQLNSQLDNYELKWTFGDKEIRYRVRRNSKEKFVYVEKVSTYEKEFKAIEKYCM